MKFTERKDFLYDTNVFKRADTQTALKMNAEYTRVHSARPLPKFFEVDRNQPIDSIRHFPLSDRTKFSREVQMPAINTFQRNKWKLTRRGQYAQREDNFYLSNLLLEEADYFPVRGDQVFWSGYRYQIVNVVLDPNGYWHQTNVWLGMLVECVIPPEGDGRPPINPAEVMPSEATQGRRGLAPEL